MKEAKLKNTQDPHQISPSLSSPHTPPPSPRINSANVNNLVPQNTLVDENDFLSYLKKPLTDRILAKIIPGKKSVKFTKFDGMQDPKIYVRKFQEEAIEYMHDRDLLAKLFSHSLKDDALKWYFQLPKNNIDRYEYLIHLFLQKFRYNIAKKVYFKDLCKIKQLPNQYVKDFVKVWKQIPNRITMPKQDLKYAFANGLLPIYKLFIISNHDMSLGDMIDIVIKKEPCIKKLYAKKNNENTHCKKSIPKYTNKIEANNVTHKCKTSPKPRQQFTPLTNTVDNVLNVLLDEELIELPPVVEPKFPNGVPKHFHYEEFCNYHRVLGHLT